MNYPASLQPTTTESMTLPSGRIVAFPKATPTFTQWLGRPVGETYGKKAILDFHGRPAFAELVILWTLQKDDWQGVWVDSFRRAFRTGYWNSAPQKSLPLKPSSIPDQVWNLAKIRSGVWDVFCWKDDRVLFAESKRGKRDRIRPSQRLFAEYALNIGVPPDSFLFVEWTTD
jgi:streptogramin lyase